MAVTKRRKFQEHLGHFKLNVDMTAGFFLLPLNSVGIKGAQHLAGAKPFLPLLAMHLCLSDIFCGLYGFSLLPPYSWNMLYLDTCSSACHRQLCSHSSYWFSCQNMYTSHFLLFLSKHSSVPMFKCLDIPFPATLPSCQSKHAAVLVETEELRSTVLQTLAAGCTVYCSLSAQKRSRSGHVSRRKYLQDDCPALCQSSSIVTWYD